MILLLKNVYLWWVWWHTDVTPALGRLRREDPEWEASLPATNKQACTFARWHLFIFLRSPLLLYLTHLKKTGCNSGVSDFRFLLHHFLTRCCSPPVCHLPFYFTRDILYFPKSCKNSIENSQVLFTYIPHIYFFLFHASFFLSFRQGLM